MADPGPSSMPVVFCEEGLRDGQADLLDGIERSEPTSTNSNPNIINPAVTYGGIDPENEDNIFAVPGMPDAGLHNGTTDTHTNFRSMADTPEPPARGSTHSEATLSPDVGCSLLEFPSELIDTILGYLSPMELSIVSQVCRRLHEHADADIHWQRYVHSNLPGNPISSPYPFKTFRELYICHDPYWFIPKHKFWFSDRHLTGQMIVAQYDQRRGVIEGYQLLGIRNRDGSEPWDEDQGVHIHYFEPIVKLHRDKPILQFNTSSFQNLVREESSAGGSSFTRTRQFQAEKPMLMNQGSDPRFSNVILAKPLTEAILQERMLSEFPYGNVWPPPQIPAAHRVPGQAMGVFPRSSRNIRPPFASTDRPANRSEMSDQAFHVRQWMEMGQPALGLHHGEEIVTYSTLDPALYTPTAEKPWRGVWVGDYSGHGCEFLLIHQPDNDNETDDEALVREENETEHAFNERFRNERVYRGRLEAIKLTGDPNVPRGEYTFVADNLANDGIVEIAEHPPFAGARMVKSRGHIASMGFLYDKFVESRLILISHDCLAQYWVGFGHISYFERVDIDQFLKP